VKALAKYLSEGHYSVDVNDNALLQSYCTFTEANDVIADIRDVVLEAI